MQPLQVLKLIRSLYGLKKIPHKLFHNIKYKLEGAGFKSIDIVDYWLFISEKFICLVYVD